MPKRIMNALTSIAQARSGSRASVIPGARILNTVPITAMAASNPESSLKVIICAQTSARFAGE